MTLATYTPAEGRVMEDHYIACAKKIGKWKDRAPMWHFPTNRGNVNQENGAECHKLPRRLTKTRYTILTAIEKGHGTRAEVILATGLSAESVAPCIYHLRSDELIETKSVSRTADARYRLTDKGINALAGMQ